jgi:hypothetical protein
MIPHPNPRNEGGNELNLGIFKEARMGKYRNTRFYLFYRSMTNASYFPGYDDIIDAFSAQA